LIGQQIANNEITITRDLSGQPCWVLADPVRLEQVILNLLSNARDALAASSGSNREIVLRTRHGRDAVVITVSDNGPGIPQEIAEKIFDPFFTTKDPGKGTGLGLSVSKKIIEEHRGRILVESPSGQGASFAIEIPTFVV
jgi:signal transduction histidine kinase